MSVYFSDFKSIKDFVEYITKNPTTKYFAGFESSKSNGYKSEKFCGTKNLDEAINLLVNGWSDVAEKMNLKLKAPLTSKEVTFKNKTFMDVCGYQCNVPAYLQGIPTNMFNTKRIKVPNKVITVNKMITYNFKTDKEVILEESVKALKIVKSIEASGIRVNLNVIFASQRNGDYLIARVRIKSSTENLNISKMAFPMVHPSMLRRIFLRWAEVFPNTPLGFVGGYGIPLTVGQLEKVFQENKLTNNKEIFFPQYISDEQMKSIESFKVF